MVTERLTRRSIPRKRATLPMLVRDRPRNGDVVSRRTAPLPRTPVFWSPPPRDNPAVLLHEARRSEAVEERLHIHQLGIAEAKRSAKRTGLEWLSQEACVCRCDLSGKRKTTPLLWLFLWLQSASQIIVPGNPRKGESATVQRGPARDVRCCQTKLDNLFSEVLRNDEIIGRGLRISFF